MEFTKKKVVIISGANGFIGSHLCKKFHDEHYEVRGLVRNPELQENISVLPNCKFYQCLLPNIIDENVFNGDIELFIHCAYEMNFQNKNQAHLINIEGTNFLIQKVKKYNIKKFIFISSMSSHDQALSFYGKSKFLLESSLKSYHSLNDLLIIRPGFVLGNGSLFKKIRNLVNKNPIIPLFCADTKFIQTIYIDDLINLIFKAFKENQKGILNISEKDGVTIREFYKGICSLEKKKRLLLEIPVTPALIFLKIMEFLKMKFPLSSENVLGLKSLKKFDIPKELSEHPNKVWTFHQSIQYIKTQEEHL